MVSKLRIGEQIKTSGGLGYVEAEAENNSYLVKYLGKDRDKGMVLYKFSGSCMFKIEPADQIEKAE